MGNRTCYFFFFHLPFLEPPKGHNIYALTHVWWRTPTLLSPLPSWCAVWSHNSSSVSYNNVCFRGKRQAILHLTRHCCLLLHSPHFVTLLSDILSLRQIYPDNHIMLDSSVLVQGHVGGRDIGKIKPDPSCGEQSININIYCVTLILFTNAASMGRPSQDSITVHEKECKWHWNDTKGWLWWTWLEAPRRHLPVLWRALSGPAHYGEHRCLWDCLWLCT